MQPYFSATNGLIVSEDDVRRLFLRRPKVRAEKHNLSRIFRILITLPLLIVFAYLALNAPAVYIKTKFALQTSNPSQTIGTAPSIPTPGLNSTLQSKNSAVLVKPAAPSELPDNRLIIERIRVNAPVRWGVDGANTDAILQSLQSGVSQLKESAMPNQSGNVFIVGHSSNYLWAKGNYKYVFALLPQLAIGDHIDLTYQNQLFEYRVSNIKTVKPDDVSVIEGDGNDQLTLMTCVPLGTSLKRLIVVADPINKSNSTPSTKISAPQIQMSLPAIR